MSARPKAAIGAVGEPANDTVTDLRLEQIRLDGKTQSRKGLNLEKIAEYAEDLIEGARFPPIVVFFDGSDYFIADGFHRWHGHDKAGIKRIDCDVRQGTSRQAFLFGANANAKHGLHRSNADKRYSVTVMLEDPEWSLWSDRLIAETCGVGKSLVADVRGQLADSASSEPRTGKDGKTRKPKTKKPKPTVCPTHNAGLNEAGECAACVSRPAKPSADMGGEAMAAEEAAPEETGEAESSDYEVSWDADVAVISMGNAIYQHIDRWPAGESLRPLIQGLEQITSVVKRREEKSRS